jgi:hypothetical protein
VDNRDEFIEQEYEELCKEVANLKEAIVRDIERLTCLACGAEFTDQDAIVGLAYGNRDDFIGYKLGHELYHRACVTLFRSLAPESTP